MNPKQLKDELRTRTLSTQGNRKELLSRLLEHATAQAASGAVLGGADAGGAPASSGDSDGDATAGPQVFSGEWDEEGVYFYQAFCDAIADWALEHQRFGGPAWNPTRMTWIKPSFAWVLYRSGYGRKHGQNRVLKVKLPHDALAELLSQCQCKHGGGGALGRVQWDPARDLMAGDGKVPRRELRRRAIQIGLSNGLSKFYAESVTSIEDVTELAHKVGEAHRSRTPRDAMAELVPHLPAEASYMPRCSAKVLRDLGMLPGATAEWVAGHGLGQAELVRATV